MKSGLAAVDVEVFGPLVAMLAQDRVDLFPAHRCRDAIARCAEDAPVGALVGDVHDELAGTAGSDLHVEGGARLAHISRGALRRLVAWAMLKERAVLEVDPLGRDEA